MKEEINTQEMYEISDLLEMDYPPKIEIIVQSVPASPVSGPLCLHIEGLDRESTFILQPGIHVATYSLYSVALDLDHSLYR